MNKIRTKANEAIGGRNKTPPLHLVQYEPEKRDREKIIKILEIIHNSKSNTPIEEMPTTSEISFSYGYDPEKYLPTCYRKFKRHATRKRIGGHKHYPVFAVCNSSGKNHGNVWEIANRAHYGNEHIAIDKFNIFDILKRFLRDILFILWFTLVIQVSIVS